MAQFKIWNGPFPTTAVRAAVDTSILIKTMLQIKSAGPPLKLLGWGFSGDAAAIAAGPRWEILTTGVIPATVTAAVAADIVPWDKQASDASIAPADRFTLGVGATGYTASAEGAIVATKVYDSVFRTPTEYYVYMFPNPPIILGTEYLRIRVKAAAAINAVCWAILEA